MTQNPIVPDPARKVIATLRGGAIELLDISGESTPRLCAVGDCKETSTTMLVGYGEETSRRWQYCADHGAEVLVWVEAQMPGMKI